MVYPFACPDWEARLREGRSLVPDLPLDPARAARAIGVFDKLRLPDVPGQPEMREAAGQWFRDIVAALFGSVDDNGVRHVPELFALVPKKNNKTTGGAAIMLTALLLNERPRAEFVLIGPTQEIADLAFQQAAGMIDADPEGYLSKRFQVQEHLKTIRDRKNKAVLRVKTFDMKVTTGSKPVGVLVDELHVMSSLSYASRVIGQIRGGLIANPESFLIFITTQSDQAPDGVMKAELDFARGVRDGRICGDHARMLPVLYEFPEAMQTAKDRPWANVKNWPMVLPNLGLSISLDRLTADFEGAKAKGEAVVRLWASQHLNVQIGLALHDGRWRGADYWEGAADPSLTLEALIERAEAAVIGIDGGGLDDLFGLCVAARCRLTKDWLYWFRAWAQPDVFEVRKEIAERLRDFERDGDLVVCAEPTQDIEEVVALCERIRDAGILPSSAGIGLDPQSVSVLVDALVAAGFNVDPSDAERDVVGVSQGFRLSSAVWGMERKLKDGTLWHSGAPMMAWCVANAKAEQRGNAVLITKQTAGKAKIDPLVAGFNATKLMERNPEASGRSVYEDRGALIV